MHSTNSCNHFHCINISRRCCVFKSTFVVYLAQPSCIQISFGHIDGCDFHYICDFVAQSEDQICCSKCSFKVKPLFMIFKFRIFQKKTSTIIIIVLILLKKSSQTGDAYAQKGSDSSLPIHWTTVFAFDGHRTSIKPLLLTPGLVEISLFMLNWTFIDHSILIFCLQMTLFFGSIFINIIFNLYSLCQQYIKRNDPMTIVCLFQILWAAFQLALMSVTLYFATAVANEVCLNRWRNSECKLCLFIFS